MKNYVYVGVNGILRQCNNKFHKPIDGVESTSNGSFNEPEWISVEDINFIEVSNWQNYYNPFLGAKLINVKR